MSTFRSIEELVKSLERERELLKEMFAKRKSLSFRYDYALEMTEYVVIKRWRHLSETLFIQWHCWTGRTLSMGKQQS